MRQQLSHVTDMIRDVSSRHGHSVTIHGQKIRDTYLPKAEDMRVFWRLLTRRSSVTEDTRFRKIRVHRQKICVYELWMHRQKICDTRQICVYGLWYVCMDCDCMDCDRMWHKKICVYELWIHRQKICVYGLWQNVTQDTALGPCTGMYMSHVCLLSMDVSQKRCGIDILDVGIVSHIFCVMYMCSTAVTSHFWYVTSHFWYVTSHLCLHT